MWDSIGTLALTCTALTRSKAPARALLLATLLFALPLAAQPQRIVSINLCTDELLLSVAAPDQIAALSWLIEDDHLTWFSHDGSAYPSVRAGVEEIVAFAPDLVVAGEYSSSSTLNLLRKLGIAVELFELPRSIAQIREQTLRMASLSGQQARGRQVVAEIDARLAALDLPARNVSGLLYRPNGLTADRGSLAHDVMRLAGISNMVVQMNIAGYERVELEQLLMADPALLIVDHHDRGAPSLAVQLLQHPALQRHGGWDLIEVPTQAWTCGSARTVRAVEMLAQAAHASALRRE